MPSGVLSLCDVEIGALLGAGLLGRDFVDIGAGIGFFAGNTLLAAVCGGGLEGIAATGRGAFIVVGRLFFTATGALFVIPVAVLFTALLGCTAVFFTPEP